MSTPSSLKSEEKRVASANWLSTSVADVNTVPSWPRPYVGGSSDKKGSAFQLPTVYRTPVPDDEIRWSRS
jgi:hypothetical protein